MEALNTQLQKVELPEASEQRLEYYKAGVRVLSLLIEEHANNNYLNQAN